MIAIKMPPPPPFALLAWGPSQVWPVSQCPRYFSGRSWYTANSISDMFHYTTSGAWDPLGKKDGQVPCRWIYFGFKTVFHGVSLVCWLCFTRPTRGIENSVSARQSQETSRSFTRQTTYALQGSLNKIGMQTAVSYGTPEVNLDLLLEWFY